MGSVGRRMLRQQQRASAKMATDPQVLAKSIQSLPAVLEQVKGLDSLIQDAQMAVVQMLGEMDAFERESRRQRAVFLRMLIDSRHPTSGFTTNDMWPAREWTMEGVASSVLSQEERLRLEYDAIMAIVNSFTQKSES